MDDSVEARKHGRIGSEAKKQAISLQLRAVNELAMKRACVKGHVVYVNVQEDSPLQSC